MSALLICGLIFVIIYLANKYFFSFWSRRNVDQLEPTFIFGNVGKMFSLKASMSDMFLEFYEKTKAKKFVGAYFSYTPILIVNDPELINDIMIKDFTTFHDRPTPGEAAENFPLVGNLFNLKGQKWRDLRVKLTPAFTSGKLKVMFPIMTQCGNVLTEHIENKMKNGTRTFDFKDLLARLTINNISSIAFGVDNDCINEPDNAFRKYGLKIFEPSLRNGLINMIAFFLPYLFYKLKIPPFAKDVEDFIYSLVNRTIEFREKNKFRRNDFMQMLIDLKDKGYVPVDKNSKENHESECDSEKEKVRKLTVDEVTAQAFIFFGAGYETSSSTMTFCLFELSRNKDVQSKVHEEIDRVMKSAGSDEITYDLLQEMKYLDCCIDETLRKYPVLPVLFRTCSNNYKIPNSDVVIEKGTAIWVPLVAIQRDPNIYEDPMAFKPERFLNSSNGNPKVPGMVYAPFGDGPRNCIGSRLGKLQAKLGLAMILQKFSFDLKDKSLQYGELTINPKSLLLAPTENIVLDVSSRK